ncbi:DUF2993 domain-containing protein [Streptomyces sp. BI20]|uniref:LmeA family phospholipid-binding protein n=1 Tax=Streptomyces sp. BI20 TaxID=3403460 RepID=UPI003C76E42F
MRFLRTLLIVGLILAGLFVGADRWAVSYAEDELAGRIQARGQTTGTEVEIAGFPFLTQVAGRDLDEVRIRMDGISAGAEGRRLRVAELTAVLRDVTLNEGYDGGTAATAEGSGLIDYAALTEASDQGVTVTYGGEPGKVKVTAGVTVLGKKVTRSVISTVSLVDGKTVRVRADEVPGEGIPGLERLVRGKTDFERPVAAALPGGLKLSGLTAEPDGVRLTVGGTNVPLTG